MMSTFKFLKKNRLIIGAVFLAVVGLFTFQNCAPTFFSMDYQSRINSLDLASLAPPVWINSGKNTNQRLVPVQLNLNQVEDGVQEKAVKFRYSFDAAAIANKPWEDIKTLFTADMESQFASDGSKDGLKNLIVELQMSRNSSVVRIEGSVVLDTLAPQIILFDVAHGQTITTKNFNEAQIKVIDSKSAVSRVCIKQKAQPPESNDRCWLTVSSLGVDSKTEIDVENIPYIIGFLRGTYVIYAFVEDEAGNISTVSLSKTIIYNPPIPPVVTDVFVANTDQMNLPPLASELKIAGSSAFIRWKILTSTPLVNQSVHVYITTNEKDYILVQEGLNNVANGGCTIDAQSTGCALLNYSFPRGYFRLRVSVKDQNGQVAVGSSMPVNTDGFQVLAGNTDPGLEGSATAAIFFNYMTTNNFESDPQSLVVTDKGQIIFRDFRRGLLTVLPNDGMIRVLIPLGERLSEGDLSTAQLTSNRARIALDHAGRVLIADSHDLRRLDLEKNEIITLVGGGSSLENATEAREFNFSTCPASCPIYPLPNGDIYFTTNSDNGISFSQGARIRKYSAADKKVYAIKPSGVGTLQDPALDVSDSNYFYDNFIIGFDPVSSQVKFLQVIVAKPIVGGREFRQSTLDAINYSPLPAVEQAPAAFGYMYNSDQYVTDRDGNAFAYSRLEARIKKYNTAEKKWDSILGTGIQGSCADATPARACDADLQAIYIGLQGYVFFADRGRIRVLNDNTPYTIAGQAFNFGDDSYAISARFGLVQYFDLDQQGRIKVLDPIENRIREFKRGFNIRSIAGNGANSAQPSGGVALNSAMYSSYWGGSTSFVADPLNGDIYTSNSGFISKLDRSTNQWISVAGGGAFLNVDGHGKKGTDVNFQYPPLVTGYHDKKLLVATHQWQQGYEYGCLINKFETNNNFVQNILIGNKQTCLDDYPDSGAVQSKSPVNTTFNNNHLMAEYLPEEKIWLGGRTYRDRIVAFKDSSDEVLVTRVTLPRSILGFARTKNAANQEIFYYCSSGGDLPGRIFKYNATTKTEIALSWPSPTIDCSGFKVKFDALAKTVIFPYRQNNLSGMAEIVDTP